MDIVKKRLWISVNDYTSINQSFRQSVNFRGEQCSAPFGTQRRSSCVLGRIMERIITGWLMTCLINRFLQMVLHYTL
jgi:hypothetical protein